MSKAKMAETILLIDDDQILLELLAEHITAGFTALTASRGEEGARLALENRPTW
jgi:DNA-binding response OmpR family regulator